MAAGTVPGTVFVADELEGTVEIHHCVPQCLLRLHDEAHAGELDGAGIEAWLEWEAEAMRYGVDPDMSRVDLEALIEASTVSLVRGDHRTLHSEATDFARWGRRGGLETLRRYGRGWFALLGRRRHGRITPEELRAGLGPAPAPLPLGAA
jgi:hypothetical protein